MASSSSRHILLALTLALSAYGGQTSGDPKPRLKVSVFQYAGAESPPGENTFSIFHGVVKSKVSHLRDVMLSVGGDYLYLKDLHVYPPLSKDALPDKLETHDADLGYWNESHSLLLFKGILPPEDRKCCIASEVVLGDLQGELPKSSNWVSFRFSSNQIPSLADTHSLMTLYALAMDARARGKEPATVLGFMAKTRNRLRDLKTKGFASDLPAGLEKAIEQVIAQEKTRMNVP